MRWLELCFMHWEVAPQALAALLPAGIEIDTFGGRAYLGVVPFRMEGIRPRGTPSVPGLSAFPELNVRTYVTVNGVPGVWFFSLDAAQKIGVRLARSFFHLPYLDAQMWTRKQGSGTEYAITEYASLRTHRNAAPARFAAAYRPIGEPFSAQPGSLEHWLTGRYALYSANRHGQIFQGDIDHAPWPLQRAEAQITVNTLAEGIGISLEGAPHLLYSEKLEVRAWLIRRVGGQRINGRQVQQS
jgi:uncharacterized protein